MGGLGPAMSALQQGRVAMRLALNVIDHVPIVNPMERGVTLPKESMQG
jgi:hypothetical protein